MALVIKCDRPECLHWYSGREKENDGKNVVTLTERCGEYSHLINSTGRCYDLCPECMKRLLQQWLKGKGKLKEDE